MQAILSLLVLVKYMYIPNIIIKTQKYQSVISFDLVRGGEKWKKVQRSKRKVKGHTLSGSTSCDGVYLSSLTSVRVNDDDDDDEF